MAHSRLLLVQHSLMPATFLPVILRAGRHLSWCSSGFMPLHFFYSSFLFFASAAVCGGQLLASSSSTALCYPNEAMPTFYIEQFGCRATQADGAAIERQLFDRGCTLASSPNAADVVVLNTCTVTGAADAQARDAIRKLHAKNPRTHIIVTGCYAQRAPEELAILPGVTYVVGNSHKPQIPNLVANSHSPVSLP